ncbi:ABC3 transporter permease protein domain-containing protein OS=Tsukamurella paurometabola (strain ATCC 8368 / DSM / CCUG 35730 / CIP 100753 / JCM 10117/ KCTC 9821 / NBRC 16120 / NCIMB 702349 / NCTC 13040) OX=521096 GN=Tpau_0645 PE=3 SV=1 [Tsukamurella paurometabola]|uniref:ABC3 transporter permease C-terminal domain-containing protein n=1 Tax=Tsukamurella paurometabola (strain ATCC 8368 / DSM 20162 / CCUG 35730 / CIP 100753 / JCM 10117 / KCTC 9821 / NBRC 16120 / NCIMB 702349 / NCTC 13040) TaxID=521096 RepID=D5USZ5_TSUPD|nr:FtsX-like permease family protein [Tsukamurella paurometabola]ADG77282.1 protein of unknown function DUF214 [Tsukamurella paurometabola DSM 20162]SUP43377.1 macrolide transporter ATP-binding /permease protein [Tsukamurella paurometabola]
MTAFRLTERRDLRAIGLVAGLSSGYGVALVIAAGALTAAGGAAGTTVALMLAALLIGMALYVSAIVISTGVSSVIVGIRPHVALLRLLGARSGVLRRRLVAEVVGVAAAASVVGAVVAGCLGVGLRAHFASRGAIPLADSGATDRFIPLVIAATVAVAAMATFTASRSVLAVSPGSALADSDDHCDPAPSVSAVRLVIATILLGLGSIALLSPAFGSLRGTDSGVLVAALGAVLLSLGVLVAAPVLLPAVVSAIGALFGRSAAASVARSNAYAYRNRTTRSTIGILTGVTVVITLATGATAVKSALAGQVSAAEFPDAARFIDMTTVVLVGITVISAIISAIGYVSVMSAGVEQRRREIGMLRVLGLRRTDVYRTTVFESLAIAGAAVATGIALGIVIGSAGSRALIPFADDIVFIPWKALAITVLAAAGVVVASAVTPARRAAAVSPIETIRP